MSSQTIELNPQLEELYENSENFRAAVRLHGDPDFIHKTLSGRMSSPDATYKGLPHVLKLISASADSNEAIVVVPSVITDDSTHGLRAQMSFLNTMVNSHGANIYAFPQDPYNIRHPDLFAEAAVNFLESDQIDRIDVVSIEDGSLVAANIAQASGSIAVCSATYINPPNIVDREYDDIVNALLDFPTSASMEKALGGKNLRYLANMYPGKPRLFRSSHAYTLARARLDYMFKDDVGRDYLDMLSKATLNDALREMYGINQVICRGEYADISPSFERIDEEKVHALVVRDTSRELMLPPYVAAAAKLAIEN